MYVFRTLKIYVSKVVGVWVLNGLLTASDK